jgi:galactose oxidase-like protein
MEAAAIRIARVVAMLATIACASPASIVENRHEAANRHETALRVIAGASLSEPRASHTATLLDDGSVLIAGGFRKDTDGYRQIYSAATETYDPDARRFRAGPPMAVARAGHTGTRLADGRVLVVGGWTGERGVSASAEIYDPARRGFVPAPPLAGARAGHTATLLADGRVLLVGGSAGDDGEALAAAEIFDPVTVRFIVTGAPAAARVGHTATLLADGRVLIVGGRAGRGGLVAVAERYDPATGRFSAAGPLNVPRYKHAAIRLDDGRVLVVGGSSERDWRGQYRDAEIYDPTTGTFRPAGTLGRARFKLPQAVVRLADGTVLIAGGSRTLERFGSGAGFAVAGELDGPRYYATATALRDGSVLIAGGYDERPQASAATWLIR